MADEGKRVIVIGAGPAGLTTAIGLQRVGIQADVFEAVPEIKPIGAGLGVQSNAFKALLRIGVGEKLPERAADIRAIDIYSSGDRRLARFPQGEIADEFGVPTLSLLRGDLQFALVDALAQGTLHLGRKCVGVEQAGGVVSARFEDGSEERGAVLVGADGVHSVVKGEVIGDSELRYSGYCGWRSWVQPSTEVMPAGESQLIIGRGHAFVMFPTADGLYWACVRKAQPGGVDPPAGVKSELIDFVSKRFPERARIAIEAADEEKILRTDIYDRLPGDRWYKGRVVLVGDAIHPSVPFVGQGAGISIEDAVVLAKELSLTGGLGDTAMVEAALQAYQDRRAPRTTGIVQHGRTRGRLAWVEHPLLCALRNATIGLVPSRVWRKHVAELIAYDI